MESTNKAIITDEVDPKLISDLMEFGFGYEESMLALKIS